MKPGGKSWCSIGIWGALGGLMLLCSCNFVERKGGGAGPETFPPGALSGQSSQVSALDAQLREGFAEAGIASPTPAPIESATMVTLGKFLYYDKILSGNQDISCATCHHPAFATSDGLSLSVGTGGNGLGPQRTIGANQPLVGRRAPHVFNLGAEGMNVLMWDGRISMTFGGLQTPEPALSPDKTTAESQPIVQSLGSALAAQALFPLVTQVEMQGQNNSLSSASTNFQVWSTLMDRVLAIPQYQKLFAGAFPDAVTFNIGHAGHAIAAYENAAFASLGTPLDSYLAGNTNALSAPAKRGAALFLGAANCVACHSGPHLTDQKFHSLALPQIGPGEDSNLDDRGRAAITNDLSENYAFRTPPLRNVCALKNGPFGHDGAYTSLAQMVMAHFDPLASNQSYDPTQLEVSPIDFTKLLNKNTTELQERLQTFDPLLKPVSLTPQEMSDLVSFLCEGLTDPSVATPSALAMPPPQVPSLIPVDN